MAIPQPLDDLLKSPTLLPEESLIAVHLKGGRGGIIFGLDSRSHKLTPGHLVVPHSGAFSGYDVDAVVDAARTRASFLANELRSNRTSGDDRSDGRNADQRRPDPWSLPPWPWR
jgi:hypothetical protein